MTSLGQLIAMAGFNFKNFFNKTRRATPPSIKVPQIPVTEKVFTEGILSGRRKSLIEVGVAIRTGIRIGSITKESALKSKLTDPLVLSIVTALLLHIMKNASLGWVKKNH